MARRYWLGWTSDGWAVLLRKVPGRPREAWVTDGPQPGADVTVRLAARPVRARRIVAERFVLARLGSLAFLDDGDPAPPIPVLPHAGHRGWSRPRRTAERDTDHWIPASTIDARPRRLLLPTRRMRGRTT